MPFNIVYLGTNIVCTNMTCGSPQKIGCEEQPRFEQYRATDPAPILTYKDTKISACFECRVPKSFAKGIMYNLLGLLVGVAAVVAVVVAVALVIGTGGLAGVAMGAVGFLVGESLGLAAIIAAGTAVITGIAYGYSQKHDCDVVSGMSWDIYHQSIQVKGEYTIVDRSLLECPRGGLIAIIMDDTIAQETASMLTSANKEIISKKSESEFWQGVVGGATGGLNPISLGISSAFHFFDWYTANSHHKEMYSNQAYSDNIITENSNDIQSGAGLVKDGVTTYKDLKSSYETVKNISEDIIAQKRGLERLTQVAITKGTKAATKHAKNQQKVVEKLISKEAEEAGNGLKKFGKNMAGLALGVIGGIVATKIADTYDEELKLKEKDMMENFSSAIDREKQTGGMVSFTLGKE